jgi:hypothetical protein
VGEHGLAVAEGVITRERSGKRTTGIKLWRERLKAPPPKGINLSGTKDRGVR